jgi:IS4 transposase
VGVAHVRGNIPVFIHITDGKVHDVNVLDVLIPEPGAIYVIDRGYLDFERLFQLHQDRSYFVIRPKSNTQYKRVYSQPVDRKTGLTCDQTIKLTGVDASRNYPKHLRRVGYVDSITGERYDYITNHLSMPALTVANLYQCRWQVELFFKWIKQHLRIKKFYGNSSNAVKTQIWIAISSYVLVAIVRKRLNLEHSLYTMLQILSMTSFEKMPLQQLFTGQEDDQIDGIEAQIALFEWK